MAEPSHNPFIPNQLSNQPPAMPPTADLSIGWTHGSSASFHDSKDSFSSPKREAQPLNLASGIKQEAHSDPGITEVRNSQNNSHHTNSDAVSGGLFPLLQKAMTSSEIAVLSCNQSTGARLLGELAQMLRSNAEYTDDARMLSINALKERSNNPPAVLGVVGGTGHGKSSLINALLEESKLVPTNCFRACTAVVTEISFNRSENPDHRYTAEIEFISAEDWGRELGYLFRDIAISEEVSNEGQLQNVDVKIAWAKVTAVYPEVSRESIGQIDPKVLADNPAIKALLGTTKTVHKRTAKELYEAIQIYVDSKKNMTVTPFGDDDNRVELWPLIKVVRIYTKADVLSTGAVIVDLPGVQDSNAARAAVAAKYIQKCSGLLVVSMITRAVNDQAAQELLGERFKQQLQLDGNFSNVTFVCSKTDDINFDEAADALGLSNEAQRLIDSERNLSTLKASSELDKLKNRKDAILTFAEEIDKHIDRYEKLRSRRAKGETVTPPNKYPKKRKSKAHIARPTKRCRLNPDNNLDQGPQDTHWVSAEDHWGSLDKDMPKFSAEHHLTWEDIQSMIEYLRSQKKSAIDENQNLQEKVYDKEDRIKSLQEETSRLKEQLNVECVSRRNECSRQAICDQFALGLRELDNRQDTGPNDLDLRREPRNYAEAGRSLPVFCVSSRAYRLLVDGKIVDGFDDIRDTEIPQLRAHTKKLTEATRIHHARSFLNDLAKTLNSLYLWSSKRGPEFYLTDEEKNTDMGYVREKVNDLEKHLQVANEEFSRQLNEILESLFKRFNIAAIHAANCAPNIARSWPSNKRAEYSQVVEVLEISMKAHLAAPLLRHLGNHWETTFAKKIPNALKELAYTCKKRQDYIHSLIQTRLRERAVFNEIMNMLQDQDKKRVTALANMINSFTSHITKTQREANRKFSPAIQKRLKPTYIECSSDEGRGVFARIKLEMETVMEKREIFVHSYKSPRAKLSVLPEDIQRELRVYIDNMRDEMISDYKNVIFGPDNSEDSKTARQRVYELLKEADERFQSEPCDANNADYIGSRRVKVKFLTN
ncbi:hypothetical protein F5Y09DRAFT_349681 [Xylaria sp. FL1042]|nr:hypothetical protein F5Y09DRAFT_349681 [Xylaria sp. FL1042]